MSLDVARYRVTSYVTSYDIANHFKISHMNENRSMFLNMTKNCQDIVRLTPMTATSCNVVQRRTIFPRWSAITLKSPIVGDRKTS